MFQCLKNSIEYTFNNPENSYKKANQINERIDFILYKFNKKNSVSIILISYIVVPFHL